LILYPATLQDLSDQDFFVESLGSFKIDSCHLQKATVIPLPFLLASLLVLSLALLNWLGISAPYSTREAQLNSLLSLLIL
jgi:hypothetical protein